MAWLVLLKSPGGSSSGERWQLDGRDETVIGRDHERSQVHLGLNAVSRQHAKIIRDRGRYFLHDLGSRNHTYLNNKQVTGPVVLHDEDCIKICDFLFRFEDAGSPKRAGFPPPLPETMRKKAAAEPPEEEADEPNLSSSTVEATVNRMPAQQLLERQPGEKLRALLDVSAALRMTLREEELLPKIAQTLFDLFRQADRCFVILVDEATGRLQPKVTQARRPLPGSESFSRTIVRRCLETLQGYLSEDASTDAQLAPSHSIAEFRIRSVMCVPLATQDGKAFGVIQLDSQDKLNKFTEDDMRLLMGVANQAAVAMENARLHEAILARERERQEVELARRVQEGFLPQTYPVVPGFEFFAHYVPAQSVGGDYYDFIPLPEGRTAVLLGDVSGHGVPAALLMAKLSAEARFCVHSRGEDLAAAVTQLNEQLLQANLLDRYVTLVAALIDPRSPEVTLVNAGHEAPLVYRAAENRLERAVPDEQGGFPLCWVPGFCYTSARVELRPGDSLILFTDGIPDALNAAGGKFGREGIFRALDGAPPAGQEWLRPGEIGERVIAAVREHAAGHSQFDDIALVCFGRVEDPVPKTFRIMAEPLSAGG